VIVVTAHMALAVRDTAVQDTTPEHNRVIVVCYRADDRYEIGIRGHWLVPERPVDAAGGTGGPTPADVVVASLANSVAHYAGRFLDRHGLSRDGLSVTADFDLTSSHPARVAAVRLEIRVPQVLSAAQRQALLAAVSHCTVDDSLVKRPAIHIDLSDGGDG
jgi:uncharacterized OsmC-like protein